MTTMLVEIYDALREAGASEETARRAAEALALTGYDERFARIEQRLSELHERTGEIRGEIAELRGGINGSGARLTMLQWVVSIMAAAEIAILVKLFVR